MRRKLVPIENPKIRFVGLSRDQRANRWEFFCTCGNIFEPLTTRFAKQLVECEKCQSEWFVNYNTEEIKKRSI